MDPVAFRRNGIRPSVFDGRDYVFDPRELGLAEHPTAGSREFSLPWPPWNQGTSSVVPCCVSAAIVTAMEILDLQAPPGQRLSLLFHYYITRGNPNVMSEVSIRDGMNAAVQNGVCRLPLHEPQPVGDVIDREAARQRPLPAAFDDAENQQIANRDSRRRKRYHHLPNVHNISHWKAAIDSGRPIVFSFWVTDSYVQLSNGSNVHGGVRGRPVGGGLHAVVACGYDDDRNAVHVRDSRGTAFAERGEWWLPYEVIESPWLIEEAWTIDAITY